MAGTTKESGYLVPDIELLTRAYSLNYYCITEGKLIDTDLLTHILEDPAPAVLEFLVGENTTVSPKLEYNSPLEDENPKLAREELRNAMLIDLYRSEDNS
jgi:acetolactate synthase-1/2/3 large subunit